MTPGVVGFCCPCPALRCGANSQQTTSVDCNDLLDHLVGTAERPRFRGTTVMEYGKGSLGFDIRGLDDRRPAGNFALHQRGEWLLTSLCLAWNVAADIDKTPRIVVVECPVSSAWVSPLRNRGSVVVRP